MRQKTIIQVWGRFGQGKSTTIKIAHQELITMYVNTTHTYSLPLPDNDITEVLTCNSYKVGIESAGDYLYYGNPNLNKRLDDLVDIHKCLIICASRVRNDVSTYIEHLASTQGYRIIKVAPYIVETPQFSRDEVNILAAKHIASIVDKLISKLI